MKRSFVIVWLVGIGCSGGGSGTPPPVDGSNPPPPPIDGSTTSTCSETADTCAGDTICVATACVPAFPRVYTLTNIKVQLPTTDPGGSSWDLGGGAPDPYVKVTIDGTDITMTAFANDVFTAMFAGPIDVQLIAGGRVTLTVFDDDVGTDTLAFTCDANPITSALLRSRKLQCVNGNNLVTYTIAPK